MNEELVHRLEQVEALTESGKDFESAELHVKELLTLQQDQKNTELYCRSLLTLSAILYQRGLALEARPYSDEALSLSKNLQQPVLEARSLSSLGLIHYTVSDYSSSLTCYNQAMSISESSGNTSAVARDLCNIGNVYWAQGEYARALEYLLRSLALDEESGNRRSMAGTLHNIGNVHQMSSNHAVALEYFRKAMAINEELGNKAWLANNISSMGNVYNYLTDLPRALEQYTTALALYEEVGNEAGKAIIYGNIGTTYHELSDYPHAIENLHKGLSLAERIGDKDGITAGLGNIGNVYMDLGDFPRALEYMEKALAIARETQSHQRVALWTANIANVYTELHQYDQALLHYNTALSMSEEFDFKRIAASCLCNMGDVYRHLYDYNAALDYYQKSLVISEGFSEQSHIAYNLGNIGAVYADENFEQHDFRKAEELLLKAIDVHREYGIKRSLYENYKSLARLYRNEARWEEAYTFIEKYYELEREVLSQDAKKKSVQLDFERKEAEQEKYRAVEKAESEARLRGTEELLHKVLPQSIAARLIKGERIADYYSSISILFADIVGFTPLSAQMPAHIVVKFLNFVFAQFDQIMKTHGCEKIKTMGDGYMAVAGAPIACDDHAERIAAAALEMQKQILLPDDIREHIDEDVVFNVRIGIHSGSAVGGIIGDERFVYDVHGDAVNLASRMESSGEPGRIHVSTEFAMHLENRMNSLNNSSIFKLIKRGQTEIKGKGMMRTYFLDRFTEASH